MSDRCPDCDEKYSKIDPVHVCGSGPYAPKLSTTRVIDKPGFYTSKAGKCEVVAVKNDLAIGWTEGGFSQTWYRSNGAIFDLDGARTDLHDITGPYIESRKLVEAYVVMFSEANSEKTTFHRTKEEALHRLSSLCVDSARLIHLREVEDEMP